MRYVLFAFALVLAACDGPADPPEAGHVQEFGFVGVGCDLVRPGGPSSGDYLDEVAAFSTTAHLCPRGETLDAAATDLAARIDRYAARGVRPFVDVQGLLFEPSGGVAPSGGPAVALAPTAEAVWEAFAAVLAARSGSLAAVYLADEPTWNGVPAADLAQAARIVEATLPDVPILVVEASPALRDLVVPPEVDWVGFDRYGVADPNADAAYLADLAALKAARSRPDQRVALVLDAQWLPLFEEAGLSPGDMGGVAESYAALAARDPSVVALVGYLWPGGLDDPEQLGARELPAGVRETYREIGQRVRSRRL